MYVHICTAGVPCGTPFVSARPVIAMGQGSAAVDCQACGAEFVFHLLMLRLVVQHLT